MGAVDEEFVGMSEGLAVLLVVGELVVVAVESCGGKEGGVS